MTGSSHLSTGVMVRNHVYLADIAGMNCRRIVTTLGIVTLMATGFLGVGSASAGTTNISEWGDNTDGYHVMIHNESDMAFPVLGLLPFSNVRPDGPKHENATSPNIDAHTTGHVYGVKSVFGGPADMNFRYVQGLDILDLHDGFMCSVTSSIWVKDTGPYVRVDFRCTGQSDKVKIEITRADKTHAFEATVRNK